MVAEGPGAIVLIGSAEAAGAGRAAARWLAAAGRTPRAVSVLETPAGFELNSEAVAARWTSAIRTQPEMRGAEVTQLPLRDRGATDDADLAAPILGADLIALGAGSPTYAVRQLRGSIAWENASAAHLTGASLLLASAGAIAAGAFALPVYEIFKVGDDVHWKEGLGLFDLYGLRLAIVPHWDSASGADKLDTSRCLMGQVRFERLQALLPADVVVVGIDEHTVLAIEPATATAEVLGRGGVTVIRGGEEEVHASGVTFPLEQLGPFRVPDAPSAERVAAVREARAGHEVASEPPADVRELAASRDQARAAKDFESADRLRERIGERGWSVEDDPRGSRLSRSPR